MAANIEKRKEKAAKRLSQKKLREKAMVDWKNESKETKGKYRTFNRYFNEFWEKQDREKFLKGTGTDKSPIDVNINSSSSKEDIIKTQEGLNLIADEIGEDVFRVDVDGIYGSETIEALEEYVVYLDKLAGGAR